MALTARYWSESLFKTLYVIAYTIPKDQLAFQQAHIESLCNAFSHLLPNEQCNKTFSDYLIDNPISLVINDRNSLLEWIHAIELYINHINNVSSISLNQRIIELNKHKPSNTQLTNTQKRSGSVSYGIRKKLLVSKPTNVINVINSAPLIDIDPIVNNNTESPVRRKNVVSYGMRRSKRK